MKMSREREHIREILRFLRPYVRWMVLGQCIMLFSVGLRMVFPWVVKEIFETMITAGEFGHLRYLVLGLTLVFVLQAATSYVKTYLLSLAGENMVKDMRMAVYERLQGLSMGFFRESRTGDLVSRITGDIALVQRTFTDGITRLLRQFFSLVVGVVILMYLDLRLTLITMLVVPGVVVTGRHLGRKVKRISREVQRRMGSLTSFVEQTLSGIEIVKSFLLEGYVTGAFASENMGVLRKSLHGVRVRAAISSLVGLFNDSVLLVVMGYGGLRVMNGFMSPAELIAYILYVQTITGPIADLTGVYADLQRALGAAERVFEILGAEPEIREAPEARSLAPMRGQVEFRDVAFAYDQGDEVLRGIRFTARPGEMVALVGPSGGGKTTLARLIPRFHDPTSGRILIDGVDIRGIRLGDLRGQIGIVPQDPFLFGVSVEDNIACGDLSAGEQRIREAARAANAHEFISNLPQGYKTRLGERGAGLSGGQRQRVALARAILKNPPVLILDEATSALDTVSERRVQEALERLTRTRTTIVIAHRLSTIRDADQILVIDRGHIVQRGTHGELIAEEGLYRRMYNSYRGERAARRTG